MFQYRSNALYPNRTIRGLSLSHCISEQKMTDEEIGKAIMVREFFLAWDCLIGFLWYCVCNCHSFKGKFVKAYVLCFLGCMISFLYAEFRFDFILRIMCLISYLIVVKTERRFASWLGRNFEKKSCCGGWRRIEAVRKCVVCHVPLICWICDVRLNRPQWIFFPWILTWIHFSTVIFDIGFISIDVFVLKIIVFLSCILQIF